MLYHFINRITYLGLAILLCFSCSEDSLGRSQISFGHASECEPSTLYASSDDEAYAFLEQKQKRIAEAFPEATDLYSRLALTSSDNFSKIEHVSQRVNEASCEPPSQNCLFEQVQLTAALTALKCNQLNTKFESPIFQDWIASDVRHFSRSNLLADFDIDELRFGSLPTGEVNGQAISVPGSEQNLIVLDRDVFRFATVFSNVLVDTISIETDEQNQTISFEIDVNRIRARLQENPENIEFFAEAIVRMVRDGSTRNMPIKPLKGHHARTHVFLYTGIVRFIVAHEIAHVHLGHVSEASSNAKFLPTGLMTRASTEHEENSTITKMDWSMNQELEADSTGFQILVDSSLVRTHPGESMVQVAAPYVVFVLHDLIDTYRKQMGTEFGAGHTHPEFSERAVNVYSEFAEHEKFLSFYERAPDFRLVFSTNLLALVEEADPIVRERLGLQPNSSYPEDLRVPTLSDLEFTDLP